MKAFLTGSSGRLGRVIAASLVARGDELVDGKGPINYLIFAHRYRGVDNYAHEMNANVTNVISYIELAKWAAGDKAVVLVSSVCATDPAVNQSLAYNLSKAALNQLARCYAKTGIVRINTVSPDTFTGEMPIVTPQEVANVILFLCSSKATGINGQDIRVSRA